MDPERVIAPEGRIRNLRIVYNQGSWTVAQLDWLHHSTGCWTKRVGMRWNGLNGDLGHPHIDGHAAWFIFPNNVIADTVLIKAREMASLLPAQISTDSALR